MCLLVTLGMVVMVFKEKLRHHVFSCLSVWTCCINTSGFHANMLTFPVESFTEWVSMLSS